MKKLILAGLLVGSTFAFAKAEDETLWCMAKGRNAQNQKVMVRGGNFRGNEWLKARKSARAACAAKGLNNCKVAWCRTEP